MITFHAGRYEACCKVTKVTFDTILQINGDVTATEITASDKTEITKALAKSSDLTNPNDITLLCVTDGTFK